MTATLTRTATSKARPQILGTPTLVSLPAAVRPLRLANDLKTLIYRSNGTYVGRSLTNGTDYGSGKDFGQTFTGGIETPGGEFLAMVRSATAGQPGHIERSTGWVLSTATATSWATVLTLQGVDASTSTEIVNAWGFAIAPSWSKHPGRIFLIEWGKQGQALRAYMSTDDGITWAVILNVSTDLFPGESYIHGHAICYDPWQGRLYISMGDAGAGGTGHCGVFYCDDLDATTRVWTAVENSVNDAASASTTGNNQVTTLFATEAGIVCLSDGYPQGLRIIRRKTGGTGIGPLETIFVVAGGASEPLYGGMLHRNGGTETPQPGAPLWATWNTSQSTTGLVRPFIMVSHDGGLSWVEAYRHATAITAGSNFTGIDMVVGPTLDNVVVAVLNLDGNYKVMQFDYLPPTPDAKSNPTKYPFRIYSGRARFDALAIDTVLNEAGNASLAGGSGALGMFDLDPSEHDRIRVELALSTNAVAPAADINLILYPVTATAGAAANVTPTIGTAVATATVTAPAANTPQALASSEIVCPAAGRYLLKVTSSATTAASSSVFVRGTVKGRAA